MEWAHNYEPGNGAGFQYPSSRWMFPEVLGRPHCAKLDHPWKVYTCAYANRTMRAVPPKDWKIPTHHMQIPRVVHRRLLRHPARVRRPEHAVLFFVPLSSEHFGLGRRCCRGVPNVTAAMLRQNPHLADSRTHRRHFLIPGRTSDNYDGLRGGPHYRGWIRSAAKYVSEIHPGDDSTWRAIPYFSASGTWRPGRPLPFTAYNRSRPLIASGSFQNRFPLAKYSGTLRYWLTKQCKAAPDCEGWFQNDFGAQEQGSLLELYRRSTYVLSPTGDTYARSATVDAMLQGAVPVVFHNISFPPGWLRGTGLRPEDVAVFVPTLGPPNGTVADIMSLAGEKARKVLPGDVVAMLRAIPRKQLLKLRAAGRRALPGLVYAEGAEAPPGGDAVDAVLRELCSEVLGASVSRADAATVVR